jgi:hypothetical protein
MRAHGLGLHDDEELPSGEYTPALAGLLAVLSRRWRNEPNAERRVTTAARMLYFAPDHALDAVTDELTDYPPEVVRLARLQDQVLAIMKTDNELAMLLQGRKHHRPKETSARSITTSRRKRLND